MAKRKITDEDIHDMFLMRKNNPGLTQEDIARYFNISRGHVSKLLNPERNVLAVHNLQKADNPDLLSNLEYLHATPEERKADKQKRKDKFGKTD